MKRTLVAVCFLAVATAAIAQSSNESLLRDLDRHICIATYTNDAAWFEKHLDDGYTLTTSSGRVVTRAQLLAQVAGKAYTMEAYEPTEVVVQIIDDDSAIIRGRILQRYTAGADRVEADLRYTDVWAKRGGEWKYMTGHASPIAIKRASLIDDVMKAYGGADALMKVTSLRETGTVTSPMRPAPGAITRLWSTPDKLTIEVSYPTNKEVRIVDGDHGTTNGKEATGMGLDAMRMQAARLALPAILAARRADVRDAGMRDGRHILELPLTASMTMSVEVDPATNHIVRSVSKGKDFEFATNYSDFRSVDGLLFAFAEENFANGTKTADTKLTAITASTAPPSPPAQ